MPPALTARLLAWASTLPGLLTLATAALSLTPLVVVFSAWLHPDPQLWAHLWVYVLPSLVGNTLLLGVGVGLGVTVLGVSLGWLTAVCEFPGRRFFSWALLLPLALPAYVTAFVWVGWLDVTGSVTLWLRSTWGLPGLPFRNGGGVIWVMSLALYPYVYLTARTAFQEQGRNLLEAAQSLGLRRRQAFWRVALPIARPAIVAGVALALMETLADFGTVAIFNYDTFTSAIYKTWFALFSLAGASQLAALLVLFVLTLLWLEHTSRSHTRAHGQRGSAPLRLPLRPVHASLASLYAGLVFALAFALPLLQLLFWAWSAAGRDLDSRYIGFIWHTLLLAGSGALLVTSVAIILGYAQHRKPRGWLRLSVRLATLGYALPGAVLAVGFFIPLVFLDNQLLALRQFWGDTNPHYWLQGTLVVMLLAYLARFLAVAFSPIESGFGRITPHLDEAAQSLGATGWVQLRRVHLPLLRGSILAALALTFVDIMKELPITLMTRPFGWDTLAVRVFEMTSEGEWERAALPAVLIALVGLLPVFFLARPAHAQR